MEPLFTLGSNFSSGKPNLFHSISDFQKPETPDLIQEIFEREAILTLGMTNVFEQDYVRSQLNKTAKDRILQSISPCRIDFSEFFKMQQQFINTDSSKDAEYPCKFVRPFSIALQPAFFSSTMLFERVKANKWMEIEIHSDFLHSNDLYAKVASLKVEPDAFVISMATAIKEGIFSNLPLIDYFPLCIMPQSTHQVIAPAAYNYAEECLKYGEYHFLLANPGTANVYFNELREKKSLSFPDVKLYHAEPNELKNILENGDQDTRVISWFPHYNLHVNYNNCVVLDSLKNSISHQGSLLLLHKRYFVSEMPGKLLLMLKKAWLSLISEEQTMKDTVTSVLSDENYAKSVFKGTGMLEEIAC